MTSRSPSGAVQPLRVGLSRSHCGAVRRSGEALRTDEGTHYGRGGDVNVMVNVMMQTRGLYVSVKDGD